MACCLKAPSRYLSQYWLLIDEVIQHSPETNFTVSVQATILYNEFENYTFKIAEFILYFTNLSIYVSKITVKPLI